MDIAIRRGRRSDASAISALIAPLAAKFIAHEFPAAAREQFLDTLSPAAIADYIASGFRYHVAETEGVLVGVVSTRDHSHIYHLFVAESAQGSGVARRLWHAAKEASRAAGYCGDFTVNSSRFAVGLYEKLGFTRDGPEDNRGGVIAVPMRFRWRAA